VPFDAPYLAPWAQAIVLVASPVGVVLAWWAKLQWSKEHTAAKDATIAALESHIKSIADDNDRLRKDLHAASEAPSVNKKFYDEVLAQFKDTHVKMRGALDDAVAKLVQKDRDILHLLESNTSLSEEDRKLIAGRNELQRKIGAIQLIVAQIDPSLQIDSSFQVSQEAPTGGPQDPFSATMQAFGGAMQGLGAATAGALKAIGIG
jgi:hypothetical protein